MPRQDYLYLQLNPRGVIFTQVTTLQCLRCLSEVNFRIGKNSIHKIFQIIYT